MSFKENLRSAMDFQDMTIKELSFKTGISKRSLENYLNARSSIPPADYACKIAEALNTTVEILVNGDSSAKFSKFKKYSKYFSLLDVFDSLPERKKAAVQNLIYEIAK